MPLVPDTLPAPVSRNAKMGPLTITIPERNRSSSAANTLKSPRESTNCFSPVMECVVTLGEALASGTRIDILAVALLHPDITVGEIARTLGYTSGAVTHHVAILERAGLIERRRRGRRTAILARHDRWACIRDACVACAPRSVPPGP
jgi:DNA-binding transcriptional ArsR family regulator